jgi:hypothetical protein
MEDVLELYAEPLDETRPVVRMDELSKELHGQGAEPIPPEPGSTAKEDYEYTRHGTANVFVLLRPLLGWRHLEVTAGRGYLQFAAVMKSLVDVHFPRAEKVRVVLDDLNTHVFGALYEAFPPEEARRIATRLEFHYTPRHGSWLNMAETEFSVLTRQRLDRRIGTAEELRAAVAAWEDARNWVGTEIEWSFRVADAREKLRWLYPS